jgi:glycosyltransferase involved in cell wall biosynthesis
MRILMCCADWGIPVGGSQGSSVHLRSLAKSLTCLDHEVRLVVSNGKGPSQPPLPVETVSHRRLWPALQGLVERVRGASAPTASQLLAASTTMAPDAPVSHGATDPSWKTRLYYEDLPRFIDRVEECFFHPAHFGRAMSRILSVFRPHAVYERYALCQTGALAAIRRTGGDRPPHLLEVNASLARERSDHGELAGAWAWWSAQREARLWRTADRVLCVSEELRQMVESAGADPARVRVIPNGVDVETFTPDRPKGTLRRMLGIGEETFLIGWLGALSPGRGAEEFLQVLAQALPEVDKARGVIIGGGPLDGACRHLAWELGLEDRVAFVGAVDHDQVPDLLVDFDIAVACYPRRGDFYFSPMKVAEYLACGLAVVSGRTGRMGAILEDGVNGLLVEPDDKQAWSRALAGLCQNSSLRAKLGQEARRRALAGPTWLGNARLVEQEILACRSAHSPGAKT